MEYKVYLAGPIAKTDFATCQGWRKKVAEAMPKHILAISPLRCKEEFLISLEKNPESNLTNIFCQHPAIFQRDRFDVKTCDLMLVYLLGATVKSAGTLCEMAWADAFDKPMVFVMDLNNIHLHPFVVGFINNNIRFENLETAIEYVIGFFPQPIQ